MSDRPNTLLDALCLAAGRQGGTIHQYDLGACRWVCDRRPSSARNTEGIYSLVWTSPEGAEYALGYTGGPDIVAVREYFGPIGAYTKIYFLDRPEPRNRAALDQLRARGLA